MENFTLGLVGGSLGCSLMHYSLEAASGMAAPSIAASRIAACGMTASGMAVLLTLNKSKIW